MFDHRLQRWPNVKPALCQGVVFAGICHLRGVIRRPRPYISLYISYAYIAACYKGHPRVSSKVPKFPSSEVPKFPELQFPKFPSSEVPKFPELQVPKFPELQVPKFPELQVPGISNNINC